MTYATQAQLIARYGQGMLINLTDRGSVAMGSIDAAVVDRALADTAEVIDGFVGVRYNLPLDAVPGLLTDLAMQIAIWKLHVSEPDPKIAKDYDSALKMLRDIGSGAMRIQAAGIEPASSGAQGVQITDRERPFTADNMLGFI